MSAAMPLAGDDLAAFRELLRGYYAGWGFEGGRAHLADARRFYAPDRDLVLYDTQPPVEGFPDAEALHRGVADRAAAAGIASVRFAPSLHHVKGWRAGDVAWTLTPYRVTAAFPDGRGELSLEPLQTHVWERRTGKNWQIVHEHTADPGSARGGMPPEESPASLAGAGDARAEQLADGFFRATGDRSPASVVMSVDPFADREVAVRRRGRARLWQAGSAAWATTLVDLAHRDGREGVGRWTFVLVRDEGNGWNIHLAHGSVPFMAAG